MRYVYGLAIFLLLLPFSLLADSPSSSVVLPLAFEKNAGQAPAEALYIARSAEGKVLLQENAVLATFAHKNGIAALKMVFAGANPTVRVSAESPTGGVANYYTGNDRKRWIEGLPLYGGVRYHGIYAGTDLVFHGRRGRLEYDFEVAPGADPSSIVLEFTGVERITIDPSGDLVLMRGDQDVRMFAPEAYQQEGKSKVRAEYRLLAGNRVGFTVGAYDRSKPLVIDPVVAYTTIIGVNNSISADAIAVDSAGNVIVAGHTSATDYPVTIGDNVGGSSGAAYVTKLNSSGTQILFSTELKSGSVDAIALDASGSVFLAGISGAGFPTTSQSLGTCSDFCNAGFAAKFDSTGHLQYSTLLASGQVLPKSIAVDGSGSAYLTGLATDNSLQTVNAYQPTYQGSICTSCYSAFFVKLNPTGTGYEFASYFSGSSGGSFGQGIALDVSGNVYLAGTGEVPLKNPLQSRSGGLFLSKFAPDGKTLLFSTNFGGANSTESVAGIGVGGDGTVYLAGNTGSHDFPYTLNAYRFPTYATDTYYNGNSVFAAAFKPDLSGLKYSTYLGQGYANAMAVSGGQIYVAGSFGPEPLPLKDPVVSDIAQGGFVLSLDSTGALTRATQFGGHNKAQVPQAMAVDGAGNIYIAGIPDSNANSTHGDIIDPVNVGTGAAYLAQTKLGFSTHFVGYATFIAKISTANQPQISLSVYQPILVLRNAGSADLRIQSITLGGGLQKRFGNCGSVVAAGASCVVTVGGSTGGSVDGGTLTINSNATPSSQTFTPVSGAAIGNALLWPDRGSLWFGAQQIGTSSPVQPVKLWNVGSSAATVGNIWTNGSLSQTNDCPGSLEPGAYCTIQVTLTPNPNAQGGNLLLIAPPGQSSIDIFGWSTYSDKPILLSAPTISFGAQQVGTPGLSRTVTVTNASSTTLTTPTATIQGPSEFSIVGTTCNAALAPHQSCVFAVEFKPTMNGQLEATMTVSSGGSQARVILNGTGLVDSAVSVSPLQLEFYYAIVDRVSYSQNVTLTNTGAAPVKLTGVSFTSAEYTETNNCENPIEPSGTCNIIVVVQPREVGDRDAIMTMTFDSAAAQAIALHADGVTPLSTQASALYFGNVTPVGSDSNPQWFSLGNGYAGGLASQPYTITVTGDFRILPSTCPNPMPKYVGCGFNVVFHPLKPGSQTGAITVTFPDTTAKIVITLTGTAASPGVTISPASLDFGSVLATTKSSSKSLTITNPQTFAVTVPQPVLSGAVNEFEVGYNCPTLEPGASCQVPIVFAPVAAGTRNATLTFQNGGTPPTPVPIALTGVGIAAPGLGVDVQGYNFGYGDVGTAGRTLTVNVRNYGPHTVALPAITVSGNAKEDFIVTPAPGCSSITAQGGTCQFTITFSPKASGERRATVSFPSGSTEGTTVSINVVGFGADFAISLTGTEANKTIEAGQSAAYNVNVQSDGGYSSQITVECVPVTASSYGACTAEPASFSLNGGSRKIVVTISPAKQALLVPGASGTWHGQSSWLFAFGFMLSIAVLRRSRRVIVPVMLFICLVGFTSCGGGGGSSAPTVPPPTITTYSYALNMKVSGTVLHSTTLTLSVQKR